MGYFGALSTVHTEGTGNQTYREHTQWGTGALTTVHTQIHRAQTTKSDKGTLRHCLLYIQREMAASRWDGRLGTEGTDNQTDRGHTQWDTLGHCQLYIQRAQTSRQT